MNSKFEPGSSLFDRLTRHRRGPSLKQTARLCVALFLGMALLALWDIGRRYTFNISGNFFGPNPIFGWLVILFILIWLIMLPAAAGLTAVAVTAGQPDNSADSLTAPGGRQIVRSCLFTTAYRLRLFLAALFGLLPLFATALVLVVQEVGLYQYPCGMGMTNPCIAGSLVTQPWWRPVTGLLEGLVMGSTIAWLGLHLGVLAALLGIWAALRTGRGDSSIRPALIPAIVGLSLAATSFLCISFAWNSRQSDIVVVMWFVLTSATAWPAPFMALIDAILVSPIIVALLGFSIYFYRKALRAVAARWESPALDKSALKLRL